MCGISGIISFTDRVEPSSIEKMISTLKHRGPNGEGVWINESSHIGLGHNRLSIIDLSDTGKQPMQFADGRYTITFNGEIYNYPELKTDLMAQGYKFKSNSDTEVLLALYDLKKEKCLGNLDGMFAFAIWDNKENILFCARDRFGEKPFYFHKNNNYFAFASEMKALFALGIQKENNRKKIYDYLLYGILEDPYDKTSTFYSNIYQLEPAHYLTVSLDNKISTKRYWDIDLSTRNDLSEEEAIERFNELFTTSIKRRLRSDVPVGSSLSGGLDSSSIVMVIDKLKKQNHIQKTFSARFKGFVKDEGEFMKMVIDKTNVEAHFVFPTIESVLHNFKTICKHQEEPFGSLSIAIQYEVMKLAKDNNITVLLDGQGADEMLAGYRGYWATFFNHLYRKDRNRFKTESLSYRSLHNEMPPYKNSLSFKLNAYSNTSFQFLSDFRRKFKSPDSNYYLGIHPDLVVENKYGKNPIFKGSTIKEHLYYSLMKQGLVGLLRYADRNAMANSVEVRLPFLSHDLVEYVFTLPDEFILNNGWTKYILRKSMEGLLPDKITWRKDKIGFEPPQEQWMHNVYFVDYLNEAKNKLRKEKIIEKDNSHLSWNYISLYSFLEIDK